MSFMAPLIAAAGPYLTAASAATSVLGAMASASAQKASAAAEKQQLDYAAGQAEASGQHAAEQQRRKTNLLISRGMAVAAASGAGTTGIEGILSGIAGEGERGAQSTLFETTEQAKGYRYKGDVGAAAAKARANATILGGVANAGMGLARFATSPVPTASAPALTAGYENTLTGKGPFTGSRYDDQIWD